MPDQMHVPHLSNTVRAVALWNVVSKVSTSINSKHHNKKITKEIKLLTLMDMVHMSSIKNLDMRLIVYIISDDLAASFGIFFKKYANSGNNVFVVVCLTISKEKEENHLHDY